MCRCNKHTHPHPHAHAGTVASVTKRLASNMVKVATHLGPTLATAFSLTIDAHATTHNNLMYITLAEAMPKLQHLRLEGPSSEVGISWFGEHCPLLSKFEIQLGVVPSEYCKSLGCQLPNLQHLLWTAGDELSADLVTHSIAYAITFHLAFHAGFSIMELDFSKRQVPVHVDGLWNMPDGSITEFRILGFKTSRFAFQHMSNFARKLKIISMPESPGRDLLTILQRSNSLQQLTISGVSPVQLLWDVWVEGQWDADAKCPAVYVEEVASYKAHLQRGFQLCCSHVSMHGTLSNIQSLVGWMAPLQHTTHCVVRSAEGVTEDEWREILQPLMPALVNLTVYVPGAESSDEEGGG